MKNDLQHTNQELFFEIRRLIEEARTAVTQTVNAGLTMLYWNIGGRINQEVLDNDRAPYGKQIVETLSRDLVIQFGKSFELRNLRRMMQFAEVFPDPEIVSTLSTQLSWSHFVELLPIESLEKRYFYARKIAEERWSVRHTRQQMARKVFERTQVGNSQLPVSDSYTTDTFKDPYFLDFLGLRDGYTAA